MTQPRPDPLAFLADELADLRARQLYRPLRVMSSAQGPIVSVDDRRRHQPVVERLPRADPPSAAARGRARGRRAVRGRLGRRPDDRRDDDPPRGARGGAGPLQGRRGDAHVPVGLHRQHRGHPDRHRRAGPDRVRRPQPRLDHRRDAAVEGAPQGLPPRATSRPCARSWPRPRSTADPRPAQPYRLILVVTDGVFSMDGDIAPLPGIVEAAEAYGAAVMVDDAHASGVLGRNGRGSVDHFGLHGRVAIQVGTLSKAVGVLGGYVAGSQDLRDILTQRARPFLFSTSHPPAVAAACLEAIHVLEEEPELIERLWANTRRFKAELARLGFDTGASETPITPVMMGDSGDGGPVQRPAVRGGRLRPADRLPDGRPGQGPDPDDRHRGPHATSSSTGRSAAFDRVGHELGLHRRVTSPDPTVDARPGTSRSTPTSTPTCRPTATSRSTSTPRPRSSAGSPSSRSPTTSTSTRAGRPSRARLRRARAGRPRGRRALGAARGRDPVRRSR